MDLTVTQGRQVYYALAWDRILCLFMRCCHTRLIGLGSVLGQGQAKWPIAPTTCVSSSPRPGMTDQSRRPSSKNVSSPQRTTGTMRKRDACPTDWNKGHTRSLGRVRYAPTVRRTVVRTNVAPKEVQAREPTLGKELSGGYSAAPAPLRSLLGPLLAHQ